MKTNKLAFTLTELLIALGVIGAIAAISIPSLMSTINNRIHATELKNTVASIQQLISDQMVAHKTKNLEDTDFANPALLLTENNFSIVKKCTDATSAKNDCWKIGTTGVRTYKSLNGSSITPWNGANYTVVTKNGAILAYTLREIYTTDGDKIIGYFRVDVNGSDSPNISGRDYFTFYVTKSGKIVDHYATQTNGDSATIDTKIEACMRGTLGTCYGAVVDSGWKITY